LAPTVVSVVKVTLLVDRSMWKPFSPDAFSVQASAIAAPFTEADREVGADGAGGTVAVAVSE
jgi:hypothetical protein